MTAPYYLSNMPAPQYGQQTAPQMDALNQERATLQGQMADARQLMQPVGQRFGTAGGALAGGMGNVLRSIAGKTKEARYADALSRNQAQRQSMMGGQGAPPLFGIGT